ncbi:MAG: YjbE family putative metal transport protein [Caulobacteraceae bacterium]|nr:YjbE family putative metal transport protein [Caulobacteraceae bacterium]
MPQTLSAFLDQANWTGPVVAFLQVVLIDLVLAGDNTVAVGVAASGLDDRHRRQVIMLGLAVAVVMRIGFALGAAALLNLIGLLLAGGLLLLWVCWKMWRELRAQLHAAQTHALRPTKSFGQAFLQILIADISMSLDNVLAVAGAAHAHPAVMVFGLLLSIALMGVAANGLSRVLSRYPAIAYVGIAIVLYVSLHMIWDGYRGAVIDLHEVAKHNAVTPDWLDISPGEVAKHTDRR